MKDLIRVFVSMGTSVILIGIAILMLVVLRGAAVDIINVMGFTLAIICIMQGIYCMYYEEKCYRSEREQQE